VAKDGRQVLVIDDDADIRYLVSEFLTEEGYDVRTADNGRVALGTLTSWHPNVILLDLMMPEMDGRGFLAIQQMDLELVRIPVIVMSASSNVQEGTECLAAADVLAKPFTIDDLLTKVKAVAT
jgi:CheY-like chemotaxis protein